VSTRCNGKLAAAPRPLRGILCDHERFWVASTTKSHCQWGFDVRAAFLAAVFTCAANSCLALEGSTAAGPIGGTDIRSALLPPPGLYGGFILFGATAFDFVDGNGKTIPALSAASAHKKLAAPFLIYVPDVQVLGGSIGIAGIVPMGEECGHLFANTTSRCMVGLGDPYVEVAWSRSFGTLRPPKYPGALPILEGLTVMLGFGVVLPAGTYDAREHRTQGISLGNNIYDFAPTLAFTYTTAPILAEGTEVSAKLYWNNYLTNPTTQYTTGTLLNVDFAVSERIGRFQLGMAGFYAVQVEDDKLFGVTVPRDGRRAEMLNLGGVLAIDTPELGASMKVKALTTALAANAVRSSGVAISWIKKFR
jgi:hypothetical protein